MRSAYPFTLSPLLSFVSKSSGNRMLCEPKAWDLFVSELLRSATSRLRVLASNTPDTNLHPNINSHPRLDRTVLTTGTRAPQIRTSENDKISPILAVMFCCSSVICQRAKIVTKAQDERGCMRQSSQHSHPRGVGRLHCAVLALVDA